MALLLVIFANKNEVFIMHVLILFLSEIISFSTYLSPVNYWHISAKTLPVLVKIYLPVLHGILGSHGLKKMYKNILDCITSFFKVHSSWYEIWKGNRSSSYDVNFNYTSFRVVNSYCPTALVLHMKKPSC